MSFIKQLLLNRTQNKPLMQVYRESLIFTLSLVFLCLEVPYIFIFRLVGATFASNLAILLTLLSLCCLLLRKYYFLTGFAITSLPSLSLLYYGSIFGKEVGAQMLCFSFIAVSFAIFTTKYPYFLTISCFFPIFVMFMLELSDYSLFPRFYLSVFQIKIIAICADLTTFLVTILALSFYFKYKHKYASVLRNKSKLSLTRFGLSQREFEIVGYIIDGFTNKEIAEALFVEVSTIKTHISRVFKKVGVNSRIQLLSIITKSVLE